MRPIAFAFVCSCLLVSLTVVATPAQAGDYYDGYRHRHGKVWYSSKCCYKKIVRHERSVRYVRTYGDDDYYDRPRSTYRKRYSHYDDYRPRHRYHDDYGYSSYARSCHWRQVPVADGRGGWVWGEKRVCD
jgi:hypothetical protein